MTICRYISMSLSITLSGGVAIWVVALWLRLSSRDKVTFGIFFKVFGQAVSLSTEAEVATHIHNEEDEIDSVEADEGAEEDEEEVKRVYDIVCTISLVGHV